MQISQSLKGKFANAETPLALSLTHREPEKVKLLLKFGGPVESIDEALFELARM